MCVIHVCVYVCVSVICVVCVVYAFVSVYVGICVYVVYMSVPTSFIRNAYRRSDHTIEENTPYH